MAFVYEKVGEENKVLWEALGWKDWGRDIVKFFLGKYWAVDKDRNIYMLAIGGFRDMPDYYDLSYKGVIVRMEVIQVGDGSRDTGGFNMVWNVKRIYIPKSIWDEKEEVLLTIKEAFRVFRARHSIDMVKSISVEIQCEPECVEVDYNGR